MKSRAFLNRLLLILLSVVVLLLLAVILWLLQRPCDCEPGPGPSPTEEVVEGNTGPKEGDNEGVNPDLPIKDDGNVPPIDGPEGDKVTADEVILGDPDQLQEQFGDQAKPATGDMDGITEDTPRMDLTPEPSDQNYGRIRFNMTTTSIEPERFLSVEGRLQASQTIDGEILYVVYLNDEVSYLGTFLDPLQAVGFPQADEGHSYSSSESGSFMISLPQELLNNETLAQTQIEFYRLSPDLDLTTALVSDNVPSLIEQSERLAVIDGEQLLSVFEDNEGGEIR